MRRLHLEEIALVDGFADQFVHVVRLVGIGRDQRVEAGFGAVERIARRAHRHPAAVVLGQIVEEIARREQRLDVILERDVGDRAFGRVGNRAAEFFLRHHFVGHRLDHIGAGDEHIAAVLHHEDEVGHRRAVNRAARARTHDQADLRHHARRQHVALEHLGIAAQRRNALLNARAAAVVDSDDRRADLHRIVHDFHHLLRVTLGQRPTKDGKILAEDINEAAVDRPRSGDDAVAGNDLVLHPEIGAIMLDISVELFERPLVEQHVEPLARGQLALAVLRIDALLPAAQGSGGAAAFHFGDIGGHSALPAQFKVSFARLGRARQMRICKVAKSQFAK